MINMAHEEYMRKNKKFNHKRSYENISLACIGVTTVLVETFR
ncbi:MAG: hypothetical protein K0S41_341 [Anaerocolumna sp.]|nr:hypothetical protein [Anaerocolumna sp.]